MMREMRRGVEASDPPDDTVCGHLVRALSDRGNVRFMLDKVEQALVDYR
jgi:hypothetical protein